MFPPQSTPSKRPKRRVESYRIYKRPHSACSQSSRPSTSSYEKATHGKLAGPTLSTPRGDKFYNQYRPLCEVCPRDRGKVAGTLQGGQRDVLSHTEFINVHILHALSLPGHPLRVTRKPPTANWWVLLLALPEETSITIDIVPCVKCAPETA